MLRADALKPNVDAERMNGLEAELPTVFESIRSVLEDFIVEGKYPSLSDCNLKHELTNSNPLTYS